MCIPTPACGDTRPQSVLRSGMSYTSAASVSARLRVKGAERLRSTAETGMNGGRALSVPEIEEQFGRNLKAPAQFFNVPLVEPSLATQNFGNNAL